MTESLTAKRIEILKKQGKNPNSATCGPQMVKYCTKMETTIKFTMINLILNMVVNVTSKWKEIFVLHLLL